MIQSQSARASPTKTPKKARQRNLSPLMAEEQRSSKLALILARNCSQLLASIRSAALEDLLPDARRPMDRRASADLYSKRGDRARRRSRS